MYGRKPPLTNGKANGLVRLPVGQLPLRRTPRSLFNALTAVPGVLLPRNSTATMASAHYSISITWEGISISVSPLAPTVPMSSSYKKAKEMTRTLRYACSNLPNYLMSHTFNADADTQKEIRCECRHGTDCRTHHPNKCLCRSSRGISILCCRWIHRLEYRTARGIEDSNLTTVCYC